MEKGQPPVLSISPNEALPSGQVPPPPRIHPRFLRRLRWLAWLCLIGGVLVGVGGALESYQAYRVMKEGIVVAGKLFSDSTLNTGKGRTSYRITVDYRPPSGGRVYRKQFTVPETLYQKTKEVGEVPVKFLASDPTASIVGDYAPAFENLAIAGGLLVVGAGLLLYLRSQWQKTKNYVLGTNRR